MKRSVYQLDVVDRPFGEVADLLHSRPNELIDPEDLVELRDRNRAVVELDAHLSPFCISCQALVEFGPFTQIDGQMSVATLRVRWEALEHRSWFPTWSGEFEAVPRADHTTQLGFVGTYQPPMGPVGGLADAVILHRVADGALRTFFENALIQLAGRVDVQSDHV